MTTRIITSEVKREMLIKLIKGYDMPFTVDIRKGKHRSVEQNRLQRLLINEIAEQLGDQTPEEVRGYCKLTLGVPIMREESELFRQKYDAIIKPLPYEQKLQLMQEPLDFPVTRLMSTAAKTRYLDAIYQHFCEKGVVLTVPEIAA